MRIAIVLRGISYAENYRDGVDFRLSIESFKKKILEPLQSQGHEISIYFATYQHCLADQLKESYGELLKKYIFINSEINKGCQKDITITALKLVVDDIENIDIVIMTRFDVHYKLRITEMNIEWDKINVLWKELLRLWNAHRRIADIMHIFPSKRYKPFIESVIALRDKSNLHKLYNLFIDKGINENEIHFVTEGYYDSSPKYQNPLLGIIRGVLTPV